MVTMMVMVMTTMVVMMVMSFIGQRLFTCAVSHGRSLWQ